MSVEHEEKSEFQDEKVQALEVDLAEEIVVENSKIEAVRLGMFNFHPPNSPLSLVCRSLSVYIGFFGCG